MSRLTDRRGGFVAGQIRQRIEGTNARRLAELERRTAALERCLAYRVRSFRGVRLESTGVQIEPDSDGWLAFSSDDSLAISRDPNKAQNHAKWKLTAEIPEAGCSDVFKTIVDSDADTADADGCADRLLLDGEEQCGAKLIRSNLATGADTGWTLSLRFPECETPGEVGGGYLRLPLDDGHGGVTCVAVAYKPCDDP